MLKIRVANKHLLTIFIAICCSATSAYAGDTGWFVITELNTGYNAHDVLVVKGSYPTPPTSCSSGVTILYPLSENPGANVDPNSKNYDGSYKLLVSAFLSGKEVRLLWTSCISNSASIRQVMVR